MDSPSVSREPKGSAYLIPQFGDHKEYLEESNVRFQI